VNVEDAEPATVEPFVDCCVTTARLLVMFELLLASLVEYKRKIDKKFLVKIFSNHCLLFY